MADEVSCAWTLVVVISRVMKCLLSNTCTLDQAYPDEAEERIINEEYKVWKKNTPYLYGERVFNYESRVTNIDRSFPTSLAQI